MHIQIISKIGQSIICRYVLLPKKMYRISNAFFNSFSFSVKLPIYVPYLLYFFLNKKQVEHNDFALMRLEEQYCCYKINELFLN